MRRNHVIALVVFLAALALVFIWGAKSPRRFQAGALQLVAPFNGATSSISRQVRAAAQGLKTLPELEEENKRLKVENDQLRITNTMLGGLAQENDGLRKALGFRENAATKFKLVPARIIARSSSTWWSNVQIDRGEQDGLDTDMPVVTDEGLVGKTTTVAATTAFVLLVADENCKVAARVEGTREAGILSGERTSTGTQPDLALNFLAKTAVPQFRPGQKVFSSGLGGVFPADLFLGTLKSVETRALDARAKVAPGVELAKLENVFVIVGKREAPTPAPARATPTPAPPRANPVTPAPTPRR